MLSARNELGGEVTNVETDGVAAEVSIDVGDGETVTAVVTRRSVENLDVEVGDQVSAVVKATDVMVENE
ncbi:TOBE domain-containing protein [Halomicrococcus gelatinilyticus]|uniref:TOBE domain-containing protein n=1 Tax=Halomicrococcus gelatinilyticus TaxID=1702103 RepID=UPI002E0D225C